MRLPAIAALPYTRRMNTQPPLEDINAIVSRFQAWTGAQTPVHTKNGVRELTYDEAIRTSRRHAGLQVPSADAKKPAPVSSPNAKPKKTGKSAGAKKKIAAPRHARRDSANIAVAPQPPAFRQVLAEKVSILPKDPSQELALAERRTTALSLRISSAEHALLKQRAAEANVSVSSYLRNCVLDVEGLRAQLARTLAEHSPVQHSNLRECLFSRPVYRLCGGYSRAHQQRWQFVSDQHPQFSCSPAGEQRLL